MKISLKKWETAIPINAVAIEVFGIKKDIQCQFDNGNFNVWTPERIKGAFNFGNGKISDLKKYAENNRNFCTLFFIM